MIPKSVLERSELKSFSYTLWNKLRTLDIRAFISRKKLPTIYQMEHFKSSLRSCLRLLSLLFKPRFAHKISTLVYRIAVLARTIFLNSFSLKHALIRYLHDFSTLLTKQTFFRIEIENREKCNFWRTKWTKACSKSGLVTDLPLFVFGRLLSNENYNLKNSL